MNLPPDIIIKILGLTNDISVWLNLELVSRETASQIGNCWRFIDGIIISQRCNKNYNHSDELCFEICRGLKRKPMGKLTFGSKCGEIGQLKWRKVLAGLLSKMSVFSSLTMSLPKNYFGSSFSNGFVFNGLLKELLRHQKGKESFLKTVSLECGPFKYPDVPGLESLMDYCGGERLQILKLSKVSDCIGFWSSIARSKHLKIMDLDFQLNSNMPQRKLPDFKFKVSQGLLALTSLKTLIIRALGRVDIEDLAETIQFLGSHGNLENLHISEFQPILLQRLLTHMKHLQQNPISKLCSENATSSSLSNGLRSLCLTVLYFTQPSDTEIDCNQFLEILKTFPKLDRIHLSKLCIDSVGKSVPGNISTGTLLSKYIRGFLFRNDSTVMSNSVLLSTTGDWCETTSISGYVAEKEHQKMLEKVIDVQDSGDISIEWFAKYMKKNPEQEHKTKLTLLSKNTTRNFSVLLPSKYTGRG